MLNLPEEVTFTNGNSTKFFYSAEGEKLRTVYTISGAISQKDYCGNIVYESGVQKYLLNDEGYYDLASGGYHYYLKDHLGNNRVVINQSGTVEQTNHYYPYGGMFASTSTGQPYKYNGKEYDTHASLNWYDYGARHYDPAIARWSTQDPLAEKYYGWNQYNYCGANPVKYIDPDGTEIVIGTFWGRIGAALGFNTYEKQVQDDLQKLRQMDGELENVVSGLEKDWRKIYIKHTDYKPADEDGKKTKGNAFIPSNKNKQDSKQNGITYLAPGGGTLYYDPQNRITNQGNERNPIIGLAHELGHALQAIAGKAIKYNSKKANQGDEINVDLGNADERYSIKLENIIRRLTNHPERSYDYYKKK